MLPARSTTAAASDGSFREPTAVRTIADTSAADSASSMGTGCDASGAPIAPARPTAPRDSRATRANMPWAYTGRDRSRQQQSSCNRVRPRVIRLLFARRTDSLGFRRLALGPDPQLQLNRSNLHHGPVGQPHLARDRQALNDCAVLASEVLKENRIVSADGSDPRVPP